MFQKTLRRPVSLEGPCLWNDGYTRLRMYPGEVDSGFQLRRVDLNPAVVFPILPHAAKVEAHRVQLRPTTYSTGSRDVPCLDFCEHLLAGLWGMGIDNVRIDVDGGELPFFDGSALAYVRAVQKAGILTQNGQRQDLEIKTSLIFTSRRALFFIRPAQKLQVNYIFFNTRLKVLKTRFFEDVEESFAERIAPARTFAVGDYPSFDYPFEIRSTGNYHYPFPTRFADEMLRHKVLDLVGDLAFLGGRLKASIWAAGTGHVQTHKAIKLLTKEIARGKLECGLDPLQAPPPIPLSDG